MAETATPAANPLAKLLATWFGSGLLPGAPGTWGSLAALPFAALFVWLGGAWALSAATVAAFVVGVWASGRHAADAGREDPGSAVIDEVAGQWLALIPAALDWRLFVVAFVAFRAADILKPWPARAAERLRGGVGIMADDIVAGVYAGIVTWVVGQFLPALTT